MVSPHPPADRNALVGRRPRGSDISRSRATRATVEPAIRPEAQPIGEIMITGGRDGEPIEHHLGCSIRAILLLAIWDEDELRGTKRPDATVADFNARQHLHFIGE